MLTNVKTKALQTKATIDWETFRIEAEEYLEDVAPEVWRKIFRPLIRGVVTDQLKQWSATLGLTFDVQPLFARAWFSKYTNGMPISIIDTTKEAVGKLIDDALKGGWSVPQMQDAIIDAFKIFEPYRSERIARTETMRASNAGTTEQFKAWGVKRHEWLSTKDDRTRTVDNGDPFEHLKDWPDGPNGEVVPITEKFQGTGEPLDYPGDPKGSAANTINCVIGDTEILSLGAIDAIIRREYTGEVIRITTSVGNPITVTPNHPILTRRGFIPAQFLNDGDNLIGGSLCKSYLLSQPDITYVPTSIEKVYDALSISFVGQRIIDSLMDFHGDGMNGDVDVITTNRILSNGIVSEKFEDIKNHLLASSDLPCFELIADSAVLGSNLDDFGSITLDRSSDMSSSNVSYSFVGSHLGHFESISFTPAADIYTSGNQAWADGSSRELEYLRQLFLADTIDIHSDEIVSIDVIPFSGHVYNLQSKSGMFLANNIITHNCRCTTLPVVEGFDDGENND